VPLSPTIIRPFGASQSKSGKQQVNVGSPTAARSRTRTESAFFFQYQYTYFLLPMSAQKEEVARSVFDHTTTTFGKIEVLQSLRCPK
jgi:hypothetical protein